jgi:hypothetical protein
MEGNLQDQEALFLEGRFEVPIVDLATSNPEFAGIFTPVPEFGGGEDWHY